MNEINAPLKFDEAIPRLYAAWECGRAFGFLYLSGANLSECLITGQIAGQEVSSLKPWNIKGIINGIEWAQKFYRDILLIISIFVDKNL